MNTRVAETFTGPPTDVPRARGAVKVQKSNRPALGELGMVEAWRIATETEAVPEK